MLNIISCSRHSTKKREREQCVYYRTSFQDRILSVASVAPTLQIHVPAMLLLSIVENYKKWGYGG
jgi:hypothetical protein